MADPVQTTQAPAEAEATGKKRLPKVTKVFNSLAELNAGQADAKAKGHTYDTRKFKVTGPKGTKFVLAYSPANAAGQVAEDLGITVEEIDPSERAAFQPTAKTVKNSIGKLSDGDTMDVFKAMGMSDAEAKKALAKLRAEQKKA